MATRKIPNAVEVRGRLRCLFALASLIACLVSGCSSDNFFQRNRDKRLTAPGPAGPELLAPLAVLEPATSDPNPPLVPPLKVYADRAQNVDTLLSLEESLRTSLINSQIMRVSSGSSVDASPSTFYDIGIREQNLRAALAAFDASFQSSLYGTAANDPPNSFFGPGVFRPNRRDSAAFNAGFAKPLVTGGKASIFYNPDPGYLFLPAYAGSSFNPSYVGQLDFILQQPLLKGGGVAVNRAPIKISQIQVEQSAWDFKKTAMASVRSVLQAYWDLYAIHVQLKAVDEVIPLLEELVRLQEEGYKAEWVIKADVAKAYAQLHYFRQQRLAVESELISRELRLRHLMGLPPADGRNLIPVTPPLDILVSPEPDMAMNEAMANQPDIVKQRLNIRIRELQVLVARNNALPSFDFRALYRMNGLGEDLGSELEQLFSAQYAEWLVGGTYSLPINRRQGRAGVRAANLSLTREKGLLQQTALTLAHDLGNEIQQLNYSFRQYQEAKQRLAAADEWLRGSRLRYENPNPEFGEGNWLLQSLNDYISALQFRTAAASEVARVLASYNGVLAQLEERKGTILSFFAIEFTHDPCRQSQFLSSRLDEDMTPLSMPNSPTGGQPSRPPEFVPAPPPGIPAPQPGISPPQPKQLPEALPSPERGTSLPLPPQSNITLPPLPPPQYGFNSPPLLPPQSDIVLPPLPETSPAQRAATSSVLGTSDANAWSPGSVRPNLAGLPALPAPAVVRRLPAVP